MIEFLEEKAVGQGETQYRLRDAIFSRQRYWGAPIPITYPEGSDLPQPVPEDQLPVTLPDLSDFQPTGTGASPLAKAEDWVNRPDGSRRETDTMPGWACSSWYFLRYPDAQNTQRFADDDIIRYWMPVDFYIGGAEHAVGHLMYARFWTKVLYDLGYLHVDEPFQRLVNQGMIQGRSSLAYKRKDRNLFVSYDLVRERVQAGQAEWADYLPIHVDIRFVQDNVMDTEAFRNWMPAYQAAEFELNTAGQFVCAEQVERMSKRYHNVVNPDEVCNEFGADTFRMYEMFMGPLEMSKPWSTEGISGVSNFLSRAWRLFVDQEGHIQLTEEAPTREELKVLHQTLKKVQEDIEALGFNTAVSQFMILVNELTRLRCHKRAVLEPFLRALAPFAPHFCEEIWERMGRTPSIADAAYPAWQEEYVREEEVEYPIQVNGKVRTKLSLPADMPKEEIEKAALNAEDVSRWIADKEVKKVIVVPGKIVNLVVA
jgi:leucyl-tRNA synthetase